MLGQSDTASRETRPHLREDFRQSARRTIDEGDAADHFGGLVTTEAAARAAREDGPEKPSGRHQATRS